MEVGPGVIERGRERRRKAGMASGERKRARRKRRKTGRKKSFGSKKENGILFDF